MIRMPDPVIVVALSWLLLNWCGMVLRAMPDWESVDRIEWRPDDRAWADDGEVVTLIGPTEIPSWWYARSDDGAERQVNAAFATMPATT